jgi:hypothetical protein
MVDACQRLERLGHRGKLSRGEALAKVLTDPAKVDRSRMSQPSPA